MTDDRLPRLLYLGDVPVEASYHGSALLYRLLQGYPSDRLCIVESASSPSLPERRLSGVAYGSLEGVRTRLLNSRFHDWYALWLSRSSVDWARKVSASLHGFEPEAVLTVAHGYLWGSAAEFARSNGLPLHLVVHDDWPRVARLPYPFTDRIDNEFRRVYAEAASRLCVSPFMVEEFERRYGAKGQVLYPARAADALKFTDPAPRVRQPGRGLVFAFAGTINSPGYSRLLRMLAMAIEPHEGQLLIFGPTTSNQAAAEGLDRPNIRLCGLLSSNELIARFRTDVDVLFVPMSFAVGDRANMEISFPSKLTDYTAVGLPLLICGPDYCSAVRWARENPGVAEVVDRDDETRISSAVDRIARDPHYLASLAASALAIGERYFSHGAAQEVFYQALSTAPIPARSAVRPTRRGGW